MKTPVLVIEEYFCGSASLADMDRDTDKFEFQFVSDFSDAMYVIQKQGVGPKPVFANYA